MRLSQYLCKKKCPHKPSRAGQEDPAFKITLPVYWRSGRDADIVGKMGIGQPSPGFITHCFALPWSGTLANSLSKRAKGLVIVEHQEGDFDA